MLFNLLAMLYSEVPVALWLQPARQRPKRNKTSVNRLLCGLHPQCHPIPCPEVFWRNRPNRSLKGSYFKTNAFASVFAMTVTVLGRPERRAISPRTCGVSTSQNFAFSKSSDWHFEHFMCDISSSHVMSHSAGHLPHRQGKSKASVRIEDPCSPLTGFHKDAPAPCVLEW